MPEINSAQREYIDKAWRDRWESILQAQNQVVNWLFTVHAGGVAGLLAYAASKGTSASVTVGVCAFSLGLVLIVLFGVFMYYFEAHHFYRFRDAVKECIAGDVDWPEFLRRSSSPDKYRTCEWLAWVSGGCGLAGVVSAAIAIT